MPFAPRGVKWSLFALNRDAPDGIATAST